MISLAQLVIFLPEKQKQIVQIKRIAKGSIDCSEEHITQGEKSLAS